MGERQRAAVVEAVAANRPEKAILLGECKWGTGAVGRRLIRELLEDKTPKVLAALPNGGAGWTIHHAFLARVEFKGCSNGDSEKPSGVGDTDATG